jgi:hypothetical protein
MKRDNGQGMFTMDFINEVSTLKDLAAAKACVTARIDASTANDVNKQKALRLVHNARTCNNLVLGMANFSLSHQGLSVR